MMGNRVVRIGKEAFLGCPNLVTVLPGKGLEEIGENAFAQCGKLENIYLPETTVKIGSDAFAGDIALRYLSLPKSLEEIGENAFPESAGKDDGEGHEIYEGITLLAVEESQGQIYAEKNGFKWIPLNPEGMTMTLPAGVQEIAVEAFMGVPARQVNIPEGCERIGDKAFANSGIRIAVIPESVEKIGKEAFPEETILLCVYESPVYEWCGKQGRIRILKEPE